MVNLWFVSDELGVVVVGACQCFWSPETHQHLRSMRIGLRLVNPGMAAKTIGKLSVTLELCDFSVYAQRVAKVDSEGGLDGVVGFVRGNSCELSGT